MVGESRDGRTPTEIAESSGTSSDLLSGFFAHCFTTTIHHDPRMSSGCYSDFGTSPLKEALGNQSNDLRDTGYRGGRYEGSASAKIPVQDDVKLECCCEHRSQKDETFCRSYRSCCMLREQSVLVGSARRTQIMLVVPSVSGFESTLGPPNPPCGAQHGESTVQIHNPFPSQKETS